MSDRKECLKKKAQHIPVLAYSKGKLKTFVRMDEDYFRQKLMIWN